MTQRKLTLVTGCGYREGASSTPAVSPFSRNGSMKANIGAWAALHLARSGHDVLLVARTAEKLSVLREHIHAVAPDSVVEVASIDVTDEAGVSALLTEKVQDRELSIVHSIGLGSGAYKLPNDNPYLRIEATPLELPTIEFDIVVRTLLAVVRAALPFFTRQGGGRVVAVSSMSAIRAFPLGYSHASAKAGLHHAIRSLALELAPRRIFVSEVLPGIVDTGLYDNPIVIEAVKEIGESFGYEYSHGLPAIDPEEVARAIGLCLDSTAHVLAVQMVAQGQWPHAGA